MVKCSCGLFYLIIARNTSWCSLNTYYTTATGVQGFTCSSLVLRAALLPAARPAMAEHMFARKHWVGQ